MTPFDRPYTTFYWSAIVNTAPSCIPIWVIWRWIISWPWNLIIGHSRSFKIVPFESLGAVSYSPSWVTMALSCISSEIKPDIGHKSWFLYPLAFGAPVMGPPRNIATPCGIEQELSYRQQIARQLRTQYVEDIYRLKYYTVTLKPRLRVTQGHWKRNHWIDHTRLSSSRVIWRWILVWPRNVG